MEMSGYGYKCSNGETFDSIALKIYGHERYASDLLCANPSLCGISTFAGGEILALPVIRERARGFGTDYAPAAAPWKE